MSGGGALPAMTARPAGRRWFDVYLALFFCLFVTHLDVYLGEHGRLGVNTIIVLLLMVGLFAAGVLVGGRGARFLDTFVDNVLASAVPLGWFVLWMAGHVFLLGSARISHADIDYLALFPIYQLGVVLFGVALGSLPGSASALSAAGHAAIVVLGASVLTDALAPGTFSALANRGAGFAQNANIAAFILASLTAVSLDYRHYRRRDTLILAIAFVAVFFTFSRAGLAQFLLVAATYAFCMLSGDNRSAQRSMAPVRLVGLAATLAVLGLIALSLPQLVDSTAIRDVRGVGERLDQLLFREGASIVVDPYRRPLIRHYFGLVTERPFLGHGTGFALGEAMPAAPFQMGPHTMYLRVWVDHGLWGLLTYCGLLASFLALMLRSGWIGGILLAVLLLIGSGFSHTLIDNKSTLVLIGLALGVTAGGRPGRHGARGRR